MAASVAIKYNNALDFGELSPFYDVKEEVHAYAVNAGADALRLAEQDVKDICAAIIKEIRKYRVAKIPGDFTEGGASPLPLRVYRSVAQ